MIYSIRYFLIFLISLAIFPVQSRQSLAADEARLQPAADFGEGTKKGFNDYLAVTQHKAFVRGKNGGWSWEKASSIERAVEVAMARCQMINGACSVYAINDTLVNGRDVATVIAELQAKFVDKRYGELFFDNAYHFKGTEQAAGAVIWSHGVAANQGENRQYGAHNYIKRFDEAGFDVYRFDRDSRNDEVEGATNRLIEGAMMMKVAGYKKIIAAGQSRGAWQSLAALREDNLFDGAIASAPAKHGNTGGNVIVNGPDDFRRMTARIENTKAAVALFVFDKDGFDPDPKWRAQRMRETVGTHGAPLLVIDRPSIASGHSGGDTIAFDRQYGDCILNFFLNPKPGLAHCD